MLLLLNARRRPISFVLPKDAYDSTWQLELDTAVSQPETLRLMGGMTYQLAPFSMVVLKLKSRRWSFLKFGIDSGDSGVAKPHLSDAPAKPAPMQEAVVKTDSKPAAPKDAVETQPAKTE
jgi:hypothetical protein